MTDLDRAAEDDLLARHATEQPDGRWLLNKDDSPGLVFMAMNGASPFVTREHALELIRLHVFYDLPPSVVVSTALFTAMAKRIRVLEEKAWIRDLP